MLLLFDIDGTLVQRASREHAEALMQALHEVHAVRTNTIERHGGVAGRTDGEIARLILLDAGVSAGRIDELADEVQAECCRIYAELCPDDLSAQVAAGIPELLEWLSATQGAKLSLVTGNFETVARIKLRAAGLGHWFAPGQGGFGSDSEDRAELPAIARRRAGEAVGLGRSWPRERTLVIGDTPRDVACAHADGVGCFAVTTGPYAAEQLDGADAIARSPAELRALIEGALAAGA